MKIISESYISWTFAASPQKSRCPAKLTGQRLCFFREYVDHSTASSMSRIADFGCAPTACFTSFPPEITTSVGILDTPKDCASSICSSTCCFHGHICPQGECFFPFGDMVADLVNNSSVFQNGNSLIQISDFHYITPSLCANRIDLRFSVSF